MALTNRQKQAISMKQKILEKGKELIEAKGFDVITVDNIVEACGIAKGTFYHYFKTKDELFSYIDYATYMQLMEEMDKIKDWPLIKKLRYYITRRLELMNEDSIHFTRQWLRHASARTYHELYGEDAKMDTNVRLIQKYLSESIENGELIPSTPVQTLARVIIFSLLGTTLCRCISDGSFSITEWTATFTDFVADSLLKPYLNNQLIDRNPNLPAKCDK